MSKLHVRIFALTPEEYEHAKANGHFPGGHGWGFDIEDDKSKQLKPWLNEMEVAAFAYHNTFKKKGAE